MEYVFIIVINNSNSNYNASWSVHDNEILLDLMHFQDKPNNKTSCEFFYVSDIKNYIICCLGQFIFVILNYDKKERM
jgi:hypothetical protein